MLQYFIDVSGAFFIGVLASILGVSGAPAAPATPAPIIVETAVRPSGNAPFAKIADDILKSAQETNTGTPTLVTPKAPLPVKPAAPSTSIPTAPSKPAVAIPVPVTPAPVKPVVPAPTPVVEPVEEKLGSEALLKKAIVNIICIQADGVHGISGTGVVVDPRGIVFTVAHVGQYFLLKDYPTTGAGKCYIRTGSPAKNAYAAELIYESSAWIKENPDTFLTSRPKGTGENDYAILAITKSITSSPLPSSFSYLPLSRKGVSLKKGDDVGTGSYGAEFLTSSEVRSSLYPTIKFAPIDDVRTFTSDVADQIVVVAGSAAQEGSSGGAVMNDDGQLIGIITTRTVKADLSLRKLQAVTIDHIRRSFKSDMREDLDSYLVSATPSVLVSLFEDKADDLRDILAEYAD